jgi:hypothetical protein
MQLASTAFYRDSFTFIFLQYDEMERTEKEEFVEYF